MKVLLATHYSAVLRLGHGLQKPHKCAFADLQNFARLIGHRAKGPRPVKGREPESRGTT